MIQKALRLQTGTIRFHRWSRKKYAMFGSVGKCVTIGRVCKSIADASLSKAKHLLLCFRDGCMARQLKGTEDAPSVCGISDSMPYRMSGGILCLIVLCLQKSDIVDKGCRCECGNVRDMCNMKWMKSSMRMINMHGGLPFF